MSAESLQSSNPTATRSMAQLLDVSIEDPCKIFVGLNANQTFQNLHLSKPHQRGNRADAKATCQLWKLVHVNLGEIDSLPVFRRQFVDRRGEHAAGAAPWGPEVHQHRCGARLNRLPT